MDHLNWWLVVDDSEFSYLCILVEFSIYFFGQFLICAVAALLSSLCVNSFLLFFLSFLKFDICVNSLYLLPLEIFLDSYLLITEVFVISDCSWAVLGHFVAALNRFIADRYSSNHSVSEYYVYEFFRVLPSNSLMIFLFLGSRKLAWKSSMC